MFNVGDIVRQREDVGSKTYSITNHKATCKVIYVYENERMEIELLEHQEECMQHNIGHKYIVDSDTFEVVKQRIILEVEW